MKGLGEELRHALRLWRKTPQPTAAAILALGLGIGGVVTLFSVVHAILLRPLPYPDADRLVTVWESLPEQGRDRIPVSVPNFFDARGEDGSFEEVSGYYSWQITLSGREGDPQRVWAAYVSPRFFELMGAKAIPGRTFLDAENQPDGPKLAILSHELWRSRFGAGVGVLGQTVFLDDVGHQVVGVMEPGFDFPEGTDLWLPLAMGASSYPRNFQFLQVVGRLRPAAALAAARSEMEGLARRLEAAYPDSNAGRRFTLTPLQDYQVRKVRPALHLLLVAVGLILLIACANVAGLLLARSAARRSEFAVRTSLGATRAHLRRQGLVESVVLACFGGAAGVLLAHLALRLFLHFGAGHVPRLAEARLDGPVLLLAVAVTLLTGLLCGLVPAASSADPDLSRWLKTAGRSSRGASGRRVLDFLVVAETALALVLLVGAGLLLRSFWELLTVDLGFEPRQVLAVEVELPLSRYPEEHQPAAFYRELLAGVEALPGVEAAGAVSFLPLSGKAFLTNFEIEGRPAPPPGQEHSGVLWAVTPGVARALGLELLAGRWLSPADEAGSPEVIVVSEAVARQYFPGESPLGKRLIFECDFGQETGVLPRAAWEVVGVVGDVKHRDLEQPAAPLLYFPQAQSNWRSMYLVARSAIDPGSLTPALRQEIRALDEKLAVAAVEPLEELLLNRRAQPRLNTLLLAALAVVGLTIAAVGVFGVTSFAVSEGRREIAVRMALGARRETILNRVLGHAATLGLISVVAGLGVSLALTKVLSSLLFGISSLHLPTLIAVSAILLGAVCAASYLPARRASRFDPAVVLRVE